jgi:hypothetical protein
MSDVFVFGAGASRAYRGNLGPFFCDDGFFPVLEELATRWSADGAIDRRPEFYDGTRWDWPSLRARIESVCGGPVSTLGLERAFTAMALRGREEEDLFCRGIELAMFWRFRGHERQQFASHIDFFRSRLAAGATLITFNYDPVLEFSLEYICAEIGLAWGPQDGYGIPFHRELSSNGDVADLTGGRPSDLRLLKLHGSMNWMVSTNEWPAPPEFLFRLQTYGGPGFLCKVENERGRRVRPVFVPPRQVKEYATFGLDNLWLQAEEALETADSLHVIGYSFPETDVCARSLMDVAAGRLHDSPNVTLVTRGPNVWAGFTERFPRATIHDRGFARFVYDSG